MAAVPHAVFWPAALARLFCQLVLVNGDFSWSELQGSSTENSHVSKGLALQVSSSRRPVAALKRQLSPSVWDGISWSFAADATTANKPNCFMTSRKNIPHNWHKIDYDATETTAVLLCTLGFIFDIDGVLKTYVEKIQGAPQALQAVEEYGIPYILMSNSGGKTDEDKAQILSRIISHKIHTEQVQQCHAPVVDALEEYRDQLVLCIGMHESPHIMRQLGFQNVITPEEMLWHYPKAYAWRKVGADRKTNFPSPVCPNAVFLMTDPPDWGLDIQMAADVVAPWRFLKKRNIPPCINGVGPGDATFHVANPDIVFAGEHPLPRLAAGSFAKALETLYKELYGEDLKYVSYGKPNLTAYNHGKAALAKHARNLMGHRVDPGTAVVFEKIYAFGDNPKVDIRGANNAKMISVLVRTGVFKGENDSTDEAAIVYDDVYQAVGEIIPPHQRG